MLELQNAWEAGTKTCKSCCYNCEVRESALECKMPNEHLETVEFDSRTFQKGKKGGSHQNI